METIINALKAQIKSAFRYTNFPTRNTEDVFATLATKVNGSNNVYIIPRFDEVKVTPVDNTTDKVEIIWADFVLHCTFHWAANDYPKGWKLMDVG